MSRLPTIIEEAEVGAASDWLHNPHAGEMLVSEFMEPLALSSPELAAALDTPVELINQTIDGRRRMNADLDLRLARYFGMSPGFFLDLQTSFELLEAKRALQGRLDHIVPRSAEAA